MNESTDTHPEPMPEAAAPGASALTHRLVSWRTALAVGLLVVGVFLIGYLPATLRVSNLERDRDAALAELRLARVQLSLASAAIDARRGEYEAARVAAVAFFTSLSDELSGRDAGAGLSLEQREALQPLLEQRDELITLLARGDPASAERMATLYHTYRQSATPWTTP